MKSRITKELFWSFTFVLILLIVRNEVVHAAETDETDYGCITKVSRDTGNSLTDDDWDFYEITNRAKTPELSCKKRDDIADILDGVKGTLGVVSVTCTASGIGAGVAVWTAYASGLTWMIEYGVRHLPCKSDPKELEKMQNEIEKQVCIQLDRAGKVTTNCPE